MPTVNARELHAFLCVQTAFKDWIARRLAEYGFIEGGDFCSFLSESTGGRPAREYALTLDMAKELAMVERTEKGKQARQYFIECERRLKSGPASISPTAIAQAIATAIIPAMQATLATAMEATVGSAVKAALAEHRQQRAEASFIPPWAARQTKRAITELAKARTGRASETSMPTILLILPHLWAGPLTLLGYLAAILGGARFVGFSSCGTAVFINADRGLVGLFFRRCATVTAYTCGAVVVIRRQRIGPRTMAHELRHVLQFLVLGPLMPIAYAVASFVSWLRGTGWYWGNALERDARAAGEAAEALP